MPSDAPLSIVPATRIAAVRLVIKTAFFILDLPFRQVCLLHCEPVICIRFMPINAAGRRFRRTAGYFFTPALRHPDARTSCRLQLGACFTHLAAINGESSHERYTYACTRPAPVARGLERFPAQMPKLRQRPDHEKLSEGARKLHGVPRGSQPSPRR